MYIIRVSSIEWDGSVEIKVDVYQTLEHAMAAFDALQRDLTLDDHCFVFETKWDQGKLVTTDVVAEWAP
jgi:hypothetical protein